MATVQQIPQRAESLRLPGLNGKHTDPCGRIRVDGKGFARDGRRLRVQGVTYGPFPPGPDGLPFPAPDRVREDFAAMRAAGINAFRTYHPPPEWLLRLADSETLAVFLDVPWPKHLCFLDSAGAQREGPAGCPRGRPGGPRPPLPVGLQRRQ
jgi:hypothetical protein